MFYLQAAGTHAPVQGTQPWLGLQGGLTAQRQSQAVDNITVILEAIGESARQSPMSEFDRSVRLQKTERSSDVAPVGVGELA